MGLDQSRNTPLGGVAWDSPLGRVSREPEGHTRNDLSRAARGEEHPIGPPSRGLTQPRETHVFPNPGPLKGSGSLWKLPQSERKPDRDMIATRDKRNRTGILSGNIEKSGDKSRGIGFG